MADNKTHAHEGSVDAFLQRAEPLARRIEGQALCDLMQRVTEEIPRMWGPSIVGFGEYHYRYESGREGTSLRIGFSPRKAALVLYGIGVGDASAFLARLGTPTTGKGCLYIKRLSDIDETVLEALIVAAWNRPANLTKIS